MRTAVLLILPLIFVSACTNPRPPEGILAQEGFDTFATPRAFDGPGTIYRIDGEGRRYLVTTLDIILPDSEEEVVPKFTSQRELTVNQLLESVGAKAELLPAKVSANLNIKSNTTIESTTAGRIRLSDEKVDAALLKWRASTEPDDASKYYLIREIVATPGLRYKVEKGWLAAAVVDFKYLNVAGYKGEPKLVNADTIELDTKFSKPMNVWYKAQRITFLPALGAGEGQFAVVKKNVPKGTLGL